jgi:hypothetical protein
MTRKNTNSAAELTNNGRLFYPVKLQTEPVFYPVKVQTEPVSYPVKVQTEPVFYPVKVQQNRMYVVVTRSASEIYGQAIQLSELPRTAFRCEVYKK